MLLHYLVNALSAHLPFKGLKPVAWYNTKTTTPDLRLSSPPQESIPEHLSDTFNGIHER